MKIICVGMNYPSRNKEMNLTLLREEDPVVFLKPDTALLKDGKPFFIPDFSAEMHYETEVVVKINRLGKNIAPRFAHRYYDEVTVGIDFTARDLQRKLMKEGKPWELSKGFDCSAVIGTFISVEDLGCPVDTIPFHLDINEKTVQEGNTNDMIFKIDEIISFVSRFFTLKIGDLIFTGTPAGVGEVELNDRLTGYIGEQALLSFQVK